MYGGGDAKTPIPALCQAPLS